jgi:hypothetical protein
VARAHSFWMIVDGTVPTAFRARSREDLLPTLRQLQRTQPEAAVVWFEAGRTWESQDAAREARELRRRAARDRKPSWRPGGAHVDPREKYKMTRDQKRARFKKRAAFDRRPPEGAGPTVPSIPPDTANPPRNEKPAGDRPFTRRPTRSFDQRERRPKPEGFERDPDRRPERPDPKAPRRKPWAAAKSAGGWKARPRPKAPWKPRGPRGPKGSS